MDNHTIANRLREYANYLESQELNVFRVRAYRRAADTIQGLERPLSEKQSDVDYATRGPETFGYVVRPDGFADHDITWPIARLLAVVLRFHEAFGVDRLGDRRTE